MKTKLLFFAFAAILLPGSFSVQAQKTVLAIAAVKTAGLAQALEGKGHFTVFALTNAAFN
ncbi:MULTISPECIES: hypothetical protein [Hydrotalea]|uniref:hypothetical protein n=1 Tax=Hydrotalea TaxID=1004300 RepID=UPI001C44F0EF|nr:MULTISPECIES: hypothetical protein [Hydrotalea]